MLGDEPGSGITIDEVAIEGARRGDGWRIPRDGATGARGPASCSTASSAETKDEDDPDGDQERAAQVQAPLGERFVALYLLVGEEGALLVDTGIRESITETLLPYLDAARIPREKLRWAVNTHCDYDHTGGNGALKARPSVGA